MAVNPPDLHPRSLRQALELFQREFRKRHPDSQFLIDGEGYEDEDIDLSIFVDGDHLELEREAAELSLAVQQATGFFILPFVQQTLPESSPDQANRPVPGMSQKQ